MSPKVLTSIRMPQDLIDRADALVERMADDVRHNLTQTVSRSYVFNLALLLGIEALEKQYPAKRKRKR